MTDQTILWQDKEIPVLTQTEVLVVGASFPGVCAALASQRAGAQTLLIEKGGVIGGQAANIHTWGLDGFFMKNGKQIIFGLPWEILCDTVKEGGSDPMWEMNLDLMQREGIKAALLDFGCEPFARNAGTEYYQLNPLNNTYVNPNAYRYICLKKLKEAGVPTLLDTPLIDTLLDEAGNVIGVVVLNAFRHLAILADRVVDCTQNGAVSAYAGHPFPYPAIYTGAHFEAAGIDIDRFIQYVRETDEDWRLRPLADQRMNPDDLEAIVKTGAPAFIHGFRTALEKAMAENPDFKLLDSNGGKLMMMYERGFMTSPFISGPRGLDLEDQFAYADAVNLVREKQWLFFKLLRDYVPGCENLCMIDSSPYVSKAHIIEKSSSGMTHYDITEENLRTGTTGRSDVIAIVTGHPGLEQNPFGWELPLAALVAKENGNLLLTGKPVCRFIHYITTCAAVGQAAGAAAAISVRNGVPLTHLDAELVRAELRSDRQGGAYRKD